MKTVSWYYDNTTHYFGDPYELDFPAVLIKRHLLNVNQIIYPRIAV